MAKPKLVVILGPTASGKTETAILLCRKFNGEIVSADSRQIYKGMDIGTAKIRTAGVPHYLIDLVNPDEDYSAAQYQEDARRAINGILKRGKIPFLVGGTGLYIRAVIDGLDIPRVSPDKELRESIARQIEAEGIEKVFEALKQKCPLLAASIKDPQNPRRVIRACEVCQILGDRVMTGNRLESPVYDTLQIGIDRDRKALYQRIDERVDRMIKQGLIEECKKLFNKYDPQLPALTGIGYKQIGMYFRGEVTLEEAVRLIKRDTRHFAKRQMTWFRRDTRIQWVEDKEEAERLVGDFLFQPLLD
ncbi:MAG: tRNA (adenosine(37)-N6)-dimethylallyltransferase MiaA [Parcubacteria group bacterium]|nr:tRNA (adenosine(37)-N6)-dimethylallyltransferase MiaA [Parcubacteria group bacterium]